MPNYGFPSSNFPNTTATEVVQEQREGDLRFPKCYDVCGEEYMQSTGLSVLQVGESKYIDMSEVKSAKKEAIALYRQYYLNCPPIPSIDFEDPQREMHRIQVPLAREVVSKGAKFLFGKERFYGVKSFVFAKGNERFQTEFEKFWRDNSMDVQLKRVARTNLWASRCFLKFTAMLTKEYSIIVNGGSEQDPSNVLTKEKIKTSDIQALYTDPEHWHCVTVQGNPRKVIAWVYQFKKDRDTYHREEIYEDVTYVYTGNVVKKNSDESYNNQIRITGSGLADATLSQTHEQIKYTLTAIVPYPELDAFPVVPFFNESDYDNDGTSVYQGMLGKFDGLNDLFTRTFYALQNQATPLLWMSGVKQGTGDDVHASDAIWVLEDKDAKLNVMQWQGTPDALFKFYEELKDLIYKSVGVPKSSDLKAFTNISGDALNAINTDIVDTTNDRRLDYEDSFRIMVRLIRKILKQSKPIEDTMTIIWGPVFAESKKDLGETMVTLAREKLVKRSRAIELHPLIPDHLKEALMQDADELEKHDEEIRQQAIDAQSARMVQRSGGAAGGNAERGKNKKGVKNGKN